MTYFKYLFNFKGFGNIKIIEKIKIIICRIKGHPNGIIYYNPGGWEPNTHCKDCGEDLG